VDPGPLARERVAVDGVARERVPEHVAGAVGHEHVMLETLAQGVVELVVGEARDRGEQPVRHRRACGRRDPQQPLGGGREPLDAREQDVAQRQRQVVGVGAALHRPEDLLDQERVALRALVDEIHQPRARRGAEDRLELALHVVTPEALELDAVHGAHALPARDQRAQRVAAVQLVGAERDDHQDAPGAQRSYEEGHEVERRPVRPVQVLDDEHQRAVLGEPLDHAQHELEQARRAAVGERRAVPRAVGVEVWQHARELRAGGPQQRVEVLRWHVAPERAERVRQRAEGKAFAAELDAAAGEDARAGRAGALGRLLHEPCLPDTRLAAQEHDGGRSRDRGLERRRQRGELGLPADEERTDQVPAHPGRILSRSRHGVWRGCQQAVISSLRMRRASQIDRSAVVARARRT
jgi:hypothetical protein